MCRYLPLAVFAVSLTTSIKAGEDASSIEKRFAQVNTALTGKFLYEYAKNEPGKTYGTSAFPILNVLGVLAQFANGTACEEILEQLNLRNKEEIKEIFPIVRKVFNSNVDVLSKLTLKVYGDQKYPFTNGFKEVYSKTFGGQTGTVNVRDPETAARIISNWVRCQTIKPVDDKNLISTVDITNNNGLVFASSHDFIVRWGNPFNPQGLKDIEFHADNNVTITMKALYGNGFLNYVKDEDLGLQLVELPLKGGKYSAQVIFPDKVSSLLELLNKFRDPSKLGALLAKKKPRCLTVYVPLGEVHLQINLGESLIKATNLTRIFSPKSANLDGITQGNVPPYVSTIKHALHLTSNQAVIDEGKAVTSDSNKSTVAKLCPGGDFPTLKINHPFLYYILMTVGNVQTPVIGGMFYREIFE